MRSAFQAALAGRARVGLTARIGQGVTYSTDAGGSFSEYVKLRKLQMEGDLLDEQPPGSGRKAPVGRGSA